MYCPAKRILDIQYDYEFNQNGLDCLVPGPIENQTQLWRWNRRDGRILAAEILSGRNEGLYTDPGGETEIARIHRAFETGLIGSGDRVITDSIRFVLK